MNPHQSTADVHTSGDKTHFRFFSRKKAFWFQHQEHICFQNSNWWACCKRLFFCGDLGKLGTTVQAVLWKHFTLWENKQLWNLLAMTEAGHVCHVFIGDPGRLYETVSLLSLIEDVGKILFSSSLAGFMEDFQLMGVVLHLRRRAGLTSLFRNKLLTNRFFLSSFFL